jgi:hypothetical protein
MYEFSRFALHPARFSLCWGLSRYRTELSTSTMLCFTLKLINPCKNNSPPIRSSPTVMCQLHTLRLLHNLGANYCGGTSQNRTDHTFIFSEVLYQLSYRTIISYHIKFTSLDNFAKLLLPSPPLVGTLRFALRIWACHASSG